MFIYFICFLTFMDEIRQVVTNLELLDLRIYDFMMIWNQYIVNKKRPHI